MERDHLFVLDPDNAPFVTGVSSSLSSRGQGCILLFMSIFVLAGMLFAAEMMREWVRLAILNSGYVDIQGEVVSRRIESDDGDSYYVTYRFVADDRVYTAEESVREALYDSLAEGESVAVRYARRDPGIATISPGRVGGLVAMTAFCLVWNGFVLTFFWLLLREALKRRRLAQRGQRIAGQIARCASHQDGDGDLVVEAHHTFRSPAGTWLQGKESHTPNDLERRPLPPPGTPVQVVYLNDQVFMML